MTKKGETIWGVPVLVPGGKIRKQVNDRIANARELDEKRRQRTLTAKQMRFVQEFIGGSGSMTQAAIDAGYSPKNAADVAQDLTNPEKNPHVVAEIQRQREDMNLRFGTTFEKHMRDLQKIRDAALAAGAYSAAVQAEYRRGQAVGTIYVERKEVRFGTIDSMSKEEVQKKLDELKRLYGGPPPKDIIDIGPQQIAASIERDPNFDIEGALSGKTRSDVLQASPGGVDDVPYHENRVEGESGDSGLPDSDTGETDFRNDGIEGSPERPEN